MAQHTPDGTYTYTQHSTHSTCLRITIMYQYCKGWQGWLVVDYLMPYVAQKARPLPKRESFTLPHAVSPPYPPQISPNSEAPLHPKLWTLSAPHAPAICYPWMPIIIGRFLQSTLGVHLGVIPATAHLRKPYA